MKMKQILLSFLLVCSIFFQASKADEPFDSIEANKALDKIAINLSVVQPTSKGLQDASSTLLKYQLRAKNCVENAEQQIKQLQLMLPSATSKAEPTKDQRYLKEKMTALDREAAECRYYILRSNEAIMAYNKAAQELTTNLILTKGPNLFTEVHDFPKYYQESIDLFDAHILSGYWVNRMVNTPTLIALCVLFLISALLGGMIRVKADLSLKERLKSDKRSPHIESFLALCKRRPWFVPFMALLMIYTFVRLTLNEDYIRLFMLESILLFTSLTMALIEFLFNPPEPALPYFAIQKSLKKRFAFRLKTLTTIISAGLFTIVLFQDQSLPLTFIYLIRDVYFSVVTLIVFSILFMLNRMPKLLAEHPMTRTFFSGIIMLFMGTILVSEWVGFQKLSTYLLRGVSLTVLFIFLAWVTNNLIQKFISGLSEHKYAWQSKFHKSLGINPMDSVPELIGFKAGFFLMIWGSFAFAMFNLWNVHYTWANEISTSMTHTIIIPHSDISFIPSRIIIGFFTFTILALLTRFLRTNMLEKARSSKHKAEQEAYGAIFGYFGFATAFVFAMLIAGVNVKGLAIIAGALSVGIGFGLQNVVSNFISGIILLLERPIKPGDRIAIGKDEGFVKQVNIRSTVISTLQNVDLIVPNAELITNQVVNQTFNNHRLRVCVKVSAAYGSDIALVESTMYEAAAEHPEVIKEGTDQPSVFLIAFGESALQFEMWCTIKNVNLKLAVLSDLNKAIDKLFKDKGIEMPYPQMDIHMRQL